MNIVSSFVIFVTLLFALSFPQAIVYGDIPERQERFGFSSLLNIKMEACKFCEGRFGFILGKKILCSAVCGSLTTTITPETNATTTSKPEATAVTTTNDASTTTTTTTATTTTTTASSK